MITIRRLNCFDYSKLKKLISYLCTDENDKLARSIMEDALGLVNSCMPLSMKFRSESFILVQDEEILGLITTVGTPGNPYKINITRLIFKENRYEIGQKLVEFVVQKLGGKGAITFCVTIDECHEELFDLFINGCGFRQCASETLWKCDRPDITKSTVKWRYAQDSDSKKIAQLYNSELVNIYKPSMERTSKEFCDKFFSGFSEYYKKRYVIENTQDIIGYFSITTADNLNYIFDITTSSGYSFDYGEIINTMLCETAQKKHDFYPVVKQKNYMKNSEDLTNYLQNNNYTPIQTQQILVKDFYKQVKVESTEWNVFVLGENQLSG